METLNCNTCKHVTQTCITVISVDLGGYSLYYFYLARCQIIFFLSSAFSIGPKSGKDGDKKKDKKEKSEKSVSENGPDTFGPDFYFDFGPNVHMRTIRK